MCRLHALLAITFVFSITDAHAETRVVFPDGAGDYPTIQSALDACHPPRIGHGWRVIDD